MKKLLSDLAAEAGLGGSHRGLLARTRLRPLLNLPTLFIILPRAWLMKSSKPKNNHCWTRRHDDADSVRKFSGHGSAFCPAKPTEALHPRPGELPDPRPPPPGDNRSCL